MILGTTAGYVEWSARLRGSARSRSLGPLGERQMRALLVEPIEGSKVARCHRLLDPTSEGPAELRESAYGLRERGDREPDPLVIALLQEEELLT